MGMTICFYFKHNEKNLKKEILLMIIESTFKDSTRDIDDVNCISFYHFLIDTLEEEVLTITSDNEISLCYCIIDLLCNFDLIEEDFTFWNHKNIKIYLKNFSGLYEQEYQDSIYKFRKIYTSIKTEFLLDFP